jgi:hypothetical protein
MTNYLWLCFGKRHNCSLHMTNNLWLCLGKRCNRSLHVTYTEMVGPGYWFSTPRKFCCLSSNISTRILSRFAELIFFIQYRVKRACMISLIRPEKKTVKKYWKIVECWYYSDIAYRNSLYDFVTVWLGFILKTFV